MCVSLFVSPTTFAVRGAKRSRCTKIIILDKDQKTIVKEFELDKLGNLVRKLPENKKQSILDKKSIVNPKEYLNKSLPVHQLADNVYVMNVNTPEAMEDISNFAFDDSQIFDDDTFEYDFDSK